MGNKQLVWPMYFAKRALKGARFSLAAGEPFPFQDKGMIRGLGKAYGVENAQELPFADLPYVETLDVGDAIMAQRIREQNMSYKDARRVLTQPAAA